MIYATLKSNLCGFALSEHNSQNRDCVDLCLNVKTFWLFMTCEKAKYFYTIQFCEGV